MAEQGLPAYRWVPGYRSTDGDLAADLGRKLGLPPDRNQADILDAIFAADDTGAPACFEVAVIGPRQNLKALAWDTPILTDRGFVPMVDVEPGMRVFHPAGHTVEVTGVSDVKLGSTCYRVTTTDGRSVVVDAGHLWTVTDKCRERNSGPRGARRRYFETVTRTTQQMFDAGVSRYRSGGRTSVTDGKTYATNEYRFILPTQEPIKSPDVPLPVDPYLFGAWLGDGTSTTAALTCHSDEVDYWAAAVEAAGFIPSRRFNHDRAWTVGITCEVGAGRQTRSLNGHLRRLGVLGNKHVPDLYLTAGTAQREALLQGLMDTDGTIERLRGQASFCSIKRPLAEAVLFLARSLGWRATLRTGRARLNGRDCGDVYHVSFTPKRTDPFSPFRMQRKAARVWAADGGKGRTTLSIAAVEPVEPVPVRCLRVDSPDGLFLAGRDLVPTHNTAVLQIAALTYLFVMDEELVIWTAHLFKTTQKAFQGMVRMIAANPDYKAKCRWPPRTANGDEAIELTTGQKIEFHARSKGSGRGFTGSKIILDEALFLRAGDLGSLAPTLATMDSAQVLYASSAGMVESEALRDIRERGRPGGDPELAYWEWCAPQVDCANPVCPHMPDTLGCALDRRDLWALANPALGLRITEKRVGQFRRMMPPAEFRREFLGWWDDPVAEAGFPMETWDACADPKSAPTGALVYTVDVSPDSRSSAIVAAIERPDGLPHLEVVEHRPRTEWLASRCKELAAHKPLAWLLDPNGPAKAAIPELRKAGIEPLHVDMGAACEGFVADVKDRKLVHLGDPVLYRAIQGAGRRDIGDGLWAWSRKRSDVDIAPLVAATGAHWGLKTVERPKPKPPAPVVERATGDSVAVGDLMGIGF